MRSNLAKLIGIFRLERSEKECRCCGTRDRTMISMLCWRALGPKRDNDLGLTTPQEVDDLTDESIGVHFPQHTVAVAGRRERSDPQNARRRRELYSPARPELRSRRNGDAGALSGIPVRGTEEIDAISTHGELRDRSPRGERLVVRVCENAAESTHDVRQPLGASVAPVPTAEELNHGEEDVEQIEVDLYGRRHVVIFAVRSRTDNPPRIENEKPSEHEDRSGREP